MLNIKQYELETFNQIISLNKKIYSIEAQMRSLFFDNVQIDSKKEILPPVISTDGYSDYERLKREKNCLNEEIKGIDKRLCNMQSFSNIINKKLKGMKITEEEKETEKNRILSNIELQLKSQKQGYLERLNKIESDPYMYLRFLDFKAGDFSKVNSKEVKEKLEELNGVLKGYTEERDSLLKDINKAEKKAEKKERASKLTLNKKSSKKGIDNQ